MMRGHEPGLMWWRAHDLKHGIMVGSRVTRFENKTSYILLHCEKRGQLRILL